MACVYHGQVRFDPVDASGIDRSRALLNLEPGEKFVFVVDDTWYEGKVQCPPESRGALSPDSIDIVTDAGYPENIDSGIFSLPAEHAAAMRDSALKSMNAEQQAPMELDSTTGRIRGWLRSADLELANLVISEKEWLEAAEATKKHSDVKQDAMQSH